MTAISAFSSSHPDVLAAYERFNADHQAADALMWEIVHEIEPEPKGRKTVRAWGSWLGFDPHKGETSDPPAGWRYHDDGRYGGWLVPRRNTKEGKALWARMQEVEFPDRDVKFPGMPHDSAQWTLRSGEHHLYSPGVRLDERDGRTVWVHWACELPDETVDPALWQRRKLSEYHAMREAAEATAAAEVSA